jgi:hypothetical protein
VAKADISRSQSENFENFFNNGFLISSDTPFKTLQLFISGSDWAKIVLGGSEKSDMACQRND